MLTIGNVHSIESRLVNVENQIRQFKATQNYGMRQIKTYSAPSLSLTSFVKSVEQGGEIIRISAIEVYLVFTGIYLDKVAQGKLRLLDYHDYGYSTRNVFYYGTENPNELRIYYASYGDSAWSGEPDPASFTEVLTVDANMPGVVKT